MSVIDRIRSGHRLCGRFLFLAAHSVPAGRHCRPPLLPIRRMRLPRFDARSRKIQSFNNSAECHGDENRQINRRYVRLLRRCSHLVVNTTISPISRWSQGWIPGISPSAVSRIPHGRGRFEFRQTQELMYFRTVVYIRCHPKKVLSTGKSASAEIVGHNAEPGHHFAQTERPRSHSSAFPDIETTRHRDPALQRSVRNDCSGPSANSGTRAARAPITPDRRGDDARRLPAVHAAADIPPPPPELNAACIRLRTRSATRSTTDSRCSCSVAHCR